MRPAPGDFPFVDAVRMLAAKHGLDIELNEERLPGHGADVLVRRTYAEVSVSTSLLLQPTAVQEFAAAHEVAHVFLRHVFWRRVLPAVAWAIIVAVLVVVGLGLAVHHLPRPAGPVVLAEGGLGLLVAGLGAWVMLARRSRRYESDADQLARSWGYTLAGTRDAHTHGENWLTLSRVYRPFRMHPLPRERAGAYRSQTPPGRDDDHDQPGPSTPSA